MVKILHTADLHLETTFQNINNISNARVRRTEQNTCFSKIIDYAAINDVNAVLIAGDIFEREHFDIRLYESYIKQMAKYPNIYFFISPGNHDFCFNNSLYHGEVPSNVKVFQGAIEKVTIDELNLNVFGFGFNSQYVMEDQLAGFSVNDDGINIMVMHGDLQAGSLYNPISKLSIKNSNLDYLALGHTHHYSGILKEGKTSYAYAGTPMGRGFDECDTKGFIIGEVYEGTTDLRFIETDVRKYIIESVDISQYDVLHEVNNEIERIISSAHKNLYRFILTGEKKETLVIDLNQLTDYFTDKVYYVEFLDETIDLINYVEIAKEMSLQGLFVKDMLNKIGNAKSDEEKKQYQLALKIGYENLR